MGTQEPTKHQYDWDVATTMAFLRAYGLENDFKLNVECNHATLAGHSCDHELQARSGARTGEPLGAAQHARLRACPGCAVPRVLEPAVEAPGLPWMGAVTMRVARGDRVRRTEDLTADWPPPACTTRPLACANLARLLMPGQRHTPAPAVHAEHQKLTRSAPVAGGVRVRHAGQRRCEHRRCADGVGHRPGARERALAVPAFTQQPHARCTCSRGQGSCFQQEAEPLRAWSARARPGKGKRVSCITQWRSAA